MLEGVLGEVEVRMDIGIESLDPLVPRTALAAMQYRAK